MFENIYSILPEAEDIKSLLNPNFYFFIHVAFDESGWWYASKKKKNGNKHCEVHLLILFMACSTIYHLSCVTLYFCHSASSWHCLPMIASEQQLCLIVNVYLCICVGACNHYSHYSSYCLQRTLRAATEICWLEHLAELKRMALMPFVSSPYSY